MWLKAGVKHRIFTILITRVLCDMLDARHVNSDCKKQLEFDFLFKNVHSVVGFLFELL